jgi:dolichol-phosphate mannosyltransferase
VIARFARFNVVGIIGFGLQTGMLMLLAAAGVPVRAAAILAVEAALLHNFVWHERWTWADCPADPGARARVGRLARFHATNGIVSIAGNALLTPALAQAGVPLALANLAAVAACSVVNFASARALVFCAKTWPTLHGQFQ